MGWRWCSIVSIPIPRSLFQKRGGSIATAKSAMGAMWGGGQAEHHVNKPTPRRRGRERRCWGGLGRLIPANRTQGNPCGLGNRRPISREKGNSEQTTINRTILVIPCYIYQVICFSVLIFSFGLYCRVFVSSTSTFHSIIPRFICDCVVFFCHTICDRMVSISMSVRGRSNIRCTHVFRRNTSSVPYPSTTTKPPLSQHAQHIG